MLDNEQQHGKLCSVLVLLAVCFLSACSAGHTAVSTVPSDTQRTLTIGATAAPASLDFTTTAGAAIPQALMGNVYEGLVRINQQGTLEPLLAHSWEENAQGTEYIFHLVKNVFFSDGTAFNAHTAQFSIDRVRSDAWTNGLKTKMSVVARTEVIDDYTLKVVLHSRSNSWLWNMGTAIGAMMSPSGIATLATDPIGTGPYTVTNWSVGTSISYKARQDYWGAPAKAKTVLLRYFADPIALSNAIRSGDIDIAYGLQSPELLEFIKRQKNLDISVGSTQGEVLLSMNNKRAPFNDVRVRQAVLYGVDRQGIIDAAWDGFGVDTGGTPVAPTDPWYVGSSPYSFDPAKARELMRQAHAWGAKITISVPSLPYAQNISEMLYSQLRDIGFDVSIESTEFPAVWLAKVMKGKDYDMSIVAHVEPRDIPTLFADPHYYLGFDNKKVQDVLREADQAPAADYNALMQEAVSEIMNDAGADTLFNLPNIVVARRSITNIPINIVSDGLAFAGIDTGTNPRVSTHATPSTAAHEEQQ
ncbi:ABC transporter substrate-binding protein [Corynebacterium sp. sy017]|uniref:ABC transporter substrate-binding protein n=1 Tax=unclassified Corynebacterium TaxID=2624378 RepID=UPI001186D408|nr:MULTISPECIES: ABC transporter substrate-binding protein [unclassified Corynebacterium]MBP3088085.1 ABC transporter substrate-binding protein [Corynebacterium sp. sy017]TSD92610.1 ABC transporter substrate-binding protein [Corynebacterium sp. SY003]